MTELRFTVKVKVRVWVRFRVRVRVRVTTAQAWPVHGARVHRCTREKAERVWTVA